MISILIHFAIILLLLLPLLTFPDPPPGAEGIRVNLGLPDQGSGVQNFAPPTPEEKPEAPQNQEEAAPPVAAPPKEATPQPAVKPDVLQTEDPEALALKKQEEEQKKLEEQKAREKQAAEEAAKKAAEEKAKRDAAEKARKEAEAEATKKKIADLFGSGKGNTGTPGNQGDPNGDPDASKLDGISTGSGTVGGGLGDRGVLSAPGITDNSQKSGTIVVRVCVDKSGNVIEAEFTQRGSTSADPSLKKLAVDNARQWRFASGGVDKQCGTITYRFVVK